MNTATKTDVGAIPPLDHDEAMRLAATEYQRFLAMLDTFEDDDWGRATDCEGWAVNDVAAHNLGNWEMAASVAESLKQLVISTRMAKARGILQIDAMTAYQVEKHAPLATAELVRRLQATAPRAVKGRRRVPAVARRRFPVPMPPPHGTKPLGYLLDTIYTRDVWMHRVDLSRATDRPMELTADHDGRIVADVVAEWARNHGAPFDLTLTGDAGGRFVTGAGGDAITLDAVEFCRTLSGRAERDGLLRTPVLF
ncbi:MAG TPA: maleylpyruvate isomerase family mycothiol-dependent enzyme [Acidimicrobiales bacterium]